MTLPPKLARTDYRDVFRADLQWVPQDAQAFFHQFRESSPGWARAASRTRDLLVAPFHLHSTRRPLRVDPTTPAVLEIGRRVGPFIVLRLSPHEVLLGDDDRHLRFRFLCALDAAHSSASATTEVEFQNIFGRLYFAVVKPFHRLIVARTLVRAAAVTVLVRR
jgi:hypothetical protein